MAQTGGFGVLAAVVKVADCGSGVTATPAGKTVRDAEKTMSYAGKIMSDIIQTTSDLFSPLANI